MCPKDTPSSVPYGYCQCGCGRKTTISDRNYVKRGIKIGDPFPYRLGHGIRKPLPPIRVEGDVAYVPVRYHGEIADYAVIDATDVPLVSGIPWHLVNGCHTSYAEGCIRADDGNPKRSVKMHRLLLNAPPGQLVDHVNQNGLDNRRSNLRFADHTLNVINRRKKPGTSSRFRGVSWSAKEQKWKAAARFKHKTYHLGGFQNEEDAARAYDRFALEHHGAFAVLNFPAEITPAAEEPR